MLLKPIAINIMVYYGWMNEQTQPTYPLTWFQLKVKLKNLIQNKILKFTNYVELTTIDEVDCCFCL
jgi:hypothetical protein